MFMADFHVVFHTLPANFLTTHLIHSHVPRLNRFDVVVARKTEFANKAHTDRALNSCHKLLLVSCAFWIKSQYKGNVFN